MSLSTMLSFALTVGLVWSVLAAQAIAKPSANTVALDPEPRDDAWWSARHQEKLRAKEVQPDVDVLLVGDSITHAWEEHVDTIWAQHFPGLSVLNLGFGGDRTENVLWRLQDGAVRGLSARVAVVMIGTNNTGHRQDKAADTAAGVAAIIDELKQRLPETKILLLAIFPRGTTTADPLRKLNTAINAQIAKLDGDERVTFVDLGDAFLADDGALLTELMPDLLHPNERGYDVWAEAMAPHLQKLLATTGKK